jgi:hypothetical protein
LEASILATQSKRQASWAVRLQRHGFLHRDAFGLSSVASEKHIQHLRTSSESSFADVVGCDVADELRFEEDWRRDEGAGSSRTVSSSLVASIDRILPGDCAGDEEWEAERWELGGEGRWVGGREAIMADCSTLSNSAYKS